MTTEHREGGEMDDLLKKTFADDLPPDVSAGMRDKIDRFRAGTTEKESRTGVWIWIFRKSIWAVVSILMLVSGSLLQALGARNPLADRISLIEIRQAVVARLAAAESMSCSARVRNENGQYLDFEIRWRSGGIPEVRVIAPDGSFLGTVDPEEAPRNPDRRIQTAAEFSSPDAVQKLLEADWRLDGYSKESGSEKGTFTVRHGMSDDRLEFTVDLGTYHPVRLVFSAGGTGTSLWEARLTF